MRKHLVIGDKVKRTSQYNSYIFGWFIWEHKYSGNETFTVTNIENSGNMIQLNNHNRWLFAELFTKVKKCISL